LGDFAAENLEQFDIFRDVVGICLSVVRETAYLADQDVPDVHCSLPISVAISTNY
jgi:hypothetical protein